MARYKEYSYDQGKLIPITFREQIVPGSFEFALNDIVDNVLDLSVFDRKFRNDDTGAPAYDPRVMLKIVLYAYSRGIIRSRSIARCCEENIIFMALSADTRPHFTTIADFISSMHDEIVPLFRNIVLYCSEEGLIGREMFAIDGCKLSSNCSKEWSDTLEGFEKRKKKIEYQIRFLLRKHKECDRKALGDEIVKKEKKAIRHLRSKARKIDRWLANNKEDKAGAKGARKSNITDNESAKMPSSHGVVQGFNGLAAVDDKHQVIVHAEAFGSGSEHELLKPMIEGIRENFKDSSDTEIFETTKVTADSGFHSEKNMEMLTEEGIDGYIADNKFRKRDPKFADTTRHKKPIDRHKTPIHEKHYFAPSDFTYDETKNILICPAGNQLYVKNRNFVVNGAHGIQYGGWKTKCRVCTIREKCLRSSKSQFRQVVIFDKAEKGVKGFFTRQMIEKFDTAMGRYIYSRRMGTVEPVFANIRSTLGLDRFTLRGRQKVNVQWNLYSIVHNIFKIWRYAPSYAG
jgi:transposase